MKTNWKLSWIAAALFSFGSFGAGMVTFAACGSNESQSNDGGAGDGTTDGPTGDGQNGDGGPIGDANVPDSIFGGDGATCMHLGGGCNTNGECCSNICLNGVCDFPQCAANGAACNANSQCCSLTCTNGTCASLNNNCETLGNPCSTSAQCCSGNCSGGTCQPSSFCTQQGDICAQNNDCCSGNCVLAQNQNIGTCGAPQGGSANCGMPDGVLCAGSGVGGDGGVVYTDGGVPTCGGACCSRSCGPYGPTGILVCQPASGCHPVGDLCTKDDDCCGASGILGGSMKPVTCNLGQNGVGICTNPMGCKPNGDVCKLMTMSCNSSCDCCAGNCETMDTCKQDNVGVPRCANLNCQDAGASCASSADCCNGNPCIPNPVDGGQPPYFCYPGVCVPNCGTCTNNADCCPGETCNQTTHLCDPCGGPDAGPPPDAEPPPPDAAPPPPDGGCSMYGQLCMVSSQCCNGLPCVSNRCQPVQ